MGWTMPSLYLHLQTLLCPCTHALNGFKPGFTVAVTHGDTTTIVYVHSYYERTANLIQRAIKYLVNLSLSFLY